jgi:hypothetical protein
MSTRFRFVFNNRNPCQSALSIPGHGQNAFLDRNPKALSLEISSEKDQGDIPWHDLLLPKDRSDGPILLWLDAHKSR